MTTANTVIGMSPFFAGLLLGFEKEFEETVKAIKVVVDGV